MKLPKELREKRDLKTKTGKRKSCSVIGCKRSAERSLSENKWQEFVEGAKLKYQENRAKKIYLCKRHYKDAKKVKKKESKFLQKKGFLRDSSGGTGRY
ncbi:MAG: hypothetical protein BAJALOKI2v1_390031 [Promethearchaeota archaeon]|nr:MAG: hypothetical protein BAJALOKI2v1_390031 [Candidatus Lokiarchaeota archaeon]